MTWRHMHANLKHDVLLEDMLDDGDQVFCLALGERRRLGAAVEDGAI